MINYFLCSFAVWGDYSTNVIDYNYDYYLPHAQLRLLLATCSITITNKQNHNVIDYDYIESNHY